MNPLSRSAAPFSLRAAAIMIALTLPTAVLAQTQQPPVKTAKTSVTKSPIKAAPKAKLFPSTMQFYVAKGEADACGKGCDTWVAVEGEVDRDAAPRFRKFLREVRGRNLPLYFYSPGGEMNQAMAMGATLRERPATGRIGQTIVKECGETQVSATCQKLKRSGRELSATLKTHGAICVSACPFIMLGATTREIGSDVALAVHYPNAILRFRGRQPPAEIRAKMRQMSLDRVGRSMVSHIGKMGIAPGFYDLTRSVKFESIHFLTRDELYRFRIDTRPLVESGWMFQSGSPAYIGKIISVKNNESNAFRDITLRLYCGRNDRFTAIWMRKPEKHDGAKSPIMLGSGENMAVLTRQSAVSDNFEIWSGSLAIDEIKPLFRNASFRAKEMIAIGDGKTSKIVDAAYDISASGLEAASTALFAACAKPADTVATPADVAPPAAAEVSVALPSLSPTADAVPAR